MIRFTHPLYLLALVPVLVALYLSFSHVHGMMKVRKRLAFAVRTLVCFLIVFALAGPEIRRKNQGTCTIFVVDRSDSISDEDRKSSEEFIDKAIGQLNSEDVAGVVAFGKNAMVEESPTGRRNLGPIASKIDGSASDLAAAVRLATASMVEGKARHIVLLSDGNETDGDLAEAAQVASTDNLTVDIVPLGRKERASEVSVVSVDAPTHLQMDQPFELRAVVDSTVDQSATLVLDRDGVAIKTVEAHLTAGRSSIVLNDKLNSTGFHKYRVQIASAHDRDNRNNTGLAFVDVHGKPRFLILQQDTHRTELASALRRNGLEVDVVGPGGVPARAEDYQNYDAILFNDINSSGITNGQMKTIQSAVRDGGVGFAMIGGENSFLPGGYYGTPIAETLPIDLNIRQRKSFPSTSVCIIVDASGSMSMLEDGIPKLRLAGKAAEETIKMMSPMDRVGLAGSADGVEFVVPMQDLKDKAKAIDQCQKLAFGGGGIYIRPSLERAEQVLMSEPTKVRHLILMADGNDSDEQQGSLPIALRMLANKITTTVVAIGSGKDVSFLKTLAAAGGGRFYLADKASQLPSIVTQDTSIMSRSAIEDGRFFPKAIAGEEALSGLDSLPALQAYCLTDSRPLARLGMKTGKDDPLLATWQYGLGTSMAFTSDAQARWASEWVPWDGFGTFWSQAVRTIARRATKNTYQTSVKYEGGKGLVEVKAFDTFGNPMTATNAKLRVTAADGAVKELALSEQAPGVYNSSFEASSIGTYIVTVTETDPRGGLRSSAYGFSVPYPAEYRSYKTNNAVLQRAVESTEGKTLTKPEEALRPLKNAGNSITEIWLFCVTLAALLLPFDIAVRRIALPIDEILKKLAARLRRKPREAKQADLVGQLSKAKTRVREAQSTTVTPQAPTEPKPTTTAAQPTQQPRQTATGATAKDLLEAKRKNRK